VPKVENLAMNSKRLVRCLAVAATLMVLACSDASRPVGPSDGSSPGPTTAGNPSEPGDTSVSNPNGTGDPGQPSDTTVSGSPSDTTVSGPTGGEPSEPSDSSAPAPNGGGEGAHLSHGQLQELLKQVEAGFKAQREKNKEAFEAAREEWKAWKKSYDVQDKLAREAWKRDHPGEHGGPEVQLLRCEPRDYQADAAIIGPNGGTLHIGQHELRIPKGALDHEELIVAEAPTSSLVDVQFAPHGLQFLKSAELKLSYQGCVLPTDTDLMVAYLGQGNKVLELPPSRDLKFDGTVEADIDHFSRYAIAW
jgi:hypothetical protein